jgi:WD40 repeat protein
MTRYLLIILAILCVGASSSCASAEVAATIPRDLLPITAENADQVRQLAVIGNGTANSVCWSPDGQTLAIAGSLGVWLFDVSHPDRQPRLLDGHQEIVLWIAFSPDGRLLASSDMSDEGDIKVWDVASGEVVLDVDGMNLVEFTPDGAYLVTETSSEIGPAVWSVETGELVAQLNRNSFTSAL